MKREHPLDPKNPKDQAIAAFLKLKQAREHLKRAGFQESNSSWDQLQRLIHTLDDDIQRMPEKP